MSNYPPGVTGFEPQIAGPTYHGLKYFDVPACSKLEVPVEPGTGFEYDGTWYACDFEGGSIEGELEGRWFDWTCPNGHDNETFLEDEDFEGQHDY